MSIIVIPCGKAKRDHPTRAGDLYIGSSYRLAKAAAVRDGRGWLILSSKHGLLHPDRVIDPYEATTKTKADVRRLAATIRSEGQYVGASVESWCPAAYTDALRLAGLDVTADPLRGMSLGFRNRWFKERP